MKEQYVNGLKEGARVDSVFAVRSKEVRSARTGEAYLSLELADRTGRIGAVMFRPGTDECGVPVGAVVRARGTVTSWRGVRRVSLDSLRPSKDYSHDDLLPSARRDRRELLGSLRGLVASVREPSMKAVLKAVFGDKAFMARFLACPAAQSHHHTCVGGLLEHTVSVASLCRDLAASYDLTDADLLVTAALLHDVGKVDELSFDTSIEYTDAGRLIGHVVLGERRIRESVARAGIAVPDDAMTRLSHTVLSHHGELEWGAPKRPCTIEALVLHHADNLDAKVTGFMEAASGAALAESSWTDAFNLFRRPLHAPRALEDDRELPPAEDEVRGDGMRVGA